MKKTQKNLARTSLSLAITGVTALLATHLQATENPFTLNPLPTGYQVADAHDVKTKEGKCGNGKCGASHNKKEKKSKKNCSEEEKSKEGACGAEKMKEGACSAERMQEGACGSKK